MTRQEFVALRDLPGKMINADIVWRSERGTRPNKVFNKIPVVNSLGHVVWLNGTYKPNLHAVTYNFVLEGVGAICRIDTNGTLHADAGRTHKHDLQQPDDPDRNLPAAVVRLDLENKSAREVWRVLCSQANIVHRGTFADP